jgi:hypothetical protein
MTKRRRLPVRAGRAGQRRDGGRRLSPRAREDVTTGVALDDLIATAHWLAGVFGQPLPGRVQRAGPLAVGGYAAAVSVDGR